MRERKFLASIAIAKQNIESNLSHNKWKKLSELNMCKMKNL